MDSFKSQTIWKSCTAKHSRTAVTWGTKARLYWEARPYATSILVDGRRINSRAKEHGQTREFDYW